MRRAYRVFRSSAIRNGPGWRAWCAAGGDYRLQCHQPTSQMGESTCYGCEVSFRFVPMACCQPLSCTGQTEACLQPACLALSCIEASVYGAIQVVIEAIWGLYLHFKPLRKLQEAYGNSPLHLRGKRTIAGNLHCPPSDCVMNDDKYLPSATAASASS